MRKIFRFVLILIVLLVAAIVLLPILFKDEIFQLVKEESNKHIKGEVIIEDMSLSLFSDFPNLTLGLTGLDIQGEEDFQDMSLVKAGEISLEIDLFSAISGNALQVESIVLSDADLYVLILQDGTANFDIMRESEETEDAAVQEESSESYSLSLKDFRLESINLVYDDRESGTYAKIDNLNHRLSGDFSEEVVAMKTNTTISALDVVMAGTSMLRKTEVEADVNLTYYAQTGQLKLDDNSLRLNDLTVQASGDVVMEDNIDLDIVFSAPSTAFREVLSLIPEVYYQDFESVQTAGTFAFNAFVKGTLDDSDVLPAFGLDLVVKDASFQYPDLPAGASDMNMEMHITKPVGTADATVVDITSFKGNFANQPVDAKLKLVHPISDPEVDMYAKTNLDLAKVAAMVPQEGLSYEGRVVTDLAVKGRMSDFENENLNAVEVSGNVLLSKFKAATSSFGLPFEMDTLAMAWNPQAVRVPTVSGKIGQSDFAGSGTLDNLMSYVLTDTTLRGRFFLSSTLFDLNELAAAVPESDVEEEAVVDSSAAGYIRIPMNLDMDIRAKVDKVLYDNMELTDAQGHLTLVDGIASLSGFQMSTMGGSIGMNGTYDSQQPQPEVLFDMDLKNLDLAEAFSKFDMISSFAPVLSTATGKLNTSFDFSSFLTEDMTPDLNTISASGLLKTVGVKVEPEVMQRVGNALNNEQYSRIFVGNSNVDFKIFNGKLEVAPFDVKIGNQSATVSGTSGLDQSIDYTMTTKLPISAIQVPAEITNLGLTGDIDVNILFGGTVTDPSISTNFGDITSGLQNQVREVIQNQIDNAREEVVNRVNEEAEKIMEQARQQAQAVKDEAKRQADRIRQEGRNAAQAVKDEAKRQGDKLIADAGSNPLKKAAAETAARTLNNEANKKAEDIIREADARAARVESEANTRADNIIRQAEERAKIED